MFETILSTFCTLFTCFVPIILLIGILGLIVWLLVRFERKGRVDESKYYERVLRDLKRIRERSAVAGEGYNSIYKYFSLKLKSLAKSIDKKGRREQVAMKQELEVVGRKVRSEKQKEDQHLTKTGFITEYSATILLYLGSIIFLAAALLLIAFSWEQFGEFTKAMILPLFAIGFTLFGVIFYKIKKVRSAGVTFLVISDILIPLAFFAFWRFYLEDTRMITFWRYWFLSSILFLGTSLLYHRNLSNVITKMLLIFGVNSILASFALSFKLRILASLLFLLEENLAVLIASHSIKDKFIRKTARTISHFVNLVLYFVSITVLPAYRHDADFIMNMALLLLPVLHIFFSYYMIKNRILYIFLLPFLLVNTLYLLFLHRVGLDNTLLVFCVYLFYFLLAEEIFIKMKRRLEQLYTYTVAVVLGSILVPSIFLTDFFEKSISNISVYALIFLVIAFFLVLYFKDKIFVYIGLVGLVAIYPISKYIFELEFEVNYLYSMGIFGVSALYLFASIIIKRLRARRSSFALLPSFYFLNLTSIVGMIFQGSEYYIVGLFFLVNMLFYFLISLFLYHGRFSFIGAFWGVGAITLIFERNYLNIQIAGFYILFGSLAYLLTEFLRVNKEKLGKIEDKNIAIFLSKFHIPSYVFIIIAYSIAFIISLFINEFYSLAIILYLILFHIFIAYRFKRRGYFLLVFIFLLAFVFKTTHFYEISSFYKDWFIFMVGIIFFTVAYAVKVMVKSKRHIRSYNRVYLKTGLFYVVLSYIFALFNLSGVPYKSFYLQFYLMLVAIQIVLLLGFISKKTFLTIIPSYMATFALWRVGRELDITNPQFYFILLGLSLHSTDYILTYKKSKLSRIRIFDLLGLLAILGVSLIQSISDGAYLIILITEGVLYSLLWPYFKKRRFIVLSTTIVVMGVIIKVINLVLSFPQWLVLGITGLALLFIAVLFLVIRKDK